MIELKSLKKSSSHQFLLLLLTLSQAFATNLLPATSANIERQTNLSNDAVIDFNQSNKLKLIKNNSTNTSFTKTLIAASTLPVVPEWSIIDWITTTSLITLGSNELPDSMGAMGTNKSGYLSVVFQRACTAPMTQGLFNKNLSQTTRGIQSLEYAFKYQNADNSFKLTNRYATPQEIASAAAFFYSELGHSLLLAQNSNWFQTSTQAVDLRTRLNTVKTKASNSLNWLMNQKTVLSNYDAADTNRLFFDANAYYLTGKALNRSDAMQLGQTFALQAIANQTSAGYFLENKGYDSSYQGVSLMKALALYTNLDSTSDITFRQKLWTAISSGVKWQMTRISSTGEVLTTGNTRVYPGGESFLGQPKTIAVGDIVMALNYYYQLSGDTTAKSAADKVLAYYSR